MLQFSAAPEEGLPGDWRLQLGLRSRDESTPLPGVTLRRTYNGESGSRPYSFYVPSTVGDHPVPLVVMLHGGTQDAESFARVTRMDELAEAYGFVVVFPEQVLHANPMRFWNWFQKRDQTRDQGEPAIIAGMVEELMESLPIDEDRVHVAGFSGGAAMSVVLARTHPDVFASIGVHSGLAYGVAEGVTSAFFAMQQGAAGPALDFPVPVISLHGDQDMTVAVGNATRVVEQLVPWGAHIAERPMQSPGNGFTVTLISDGGRVVAERWIFHGHGHAWSGGRAGQPFSRPDGPDASMEMLRFFSQHPRVKVPALID